MEFPYPTPASQVAAQRLVTCSPTSVDSWDVKARQMPRSRGGFARRKRRVFRVGKRLEKLVTQQGKRPSHIDPASATLPKKFHPRTSKLRRRMRPRLTNRGFGPGKPVRFTLQLGIRLLCRGDRVISLEPDAHYGHPLDLRTEPNAPRSRVRTPSTIWEDLGIGVAAFAMAAVVIGIGLWTQYVTGAFFILAAAILAWHSGFRPAFISSASARRRRPAGHHPRRARRAHQHAGPRDIGG